MGLLQLLFSVAVVASTTRLGHALDCTTERLSRLDVVPCDARDDTTFPQANEYAIYRTRVRFDSVTNIPNCRHRRITTNNEMILPIDTRGTDNLRVIYSPGFDVIPQVVYRDELLVSYNIQCADNQLAFYNITELDLQPLCDGSCVDYVTIDRGNFGVTESCGTDPANNMIQIDSHQLNVTFRSSFADRFSGFAAYIICFDPADSGPGESNSTSNATRRKRDLNEFRSVWERELQRTEGLRCFNLTIRYNDTVNFIKGAIKVFRNGELLTSISNIIVLHTLDGEGRSEEFQENAIPSKSYRKIQPLVFDGPGLLFVVGAYGFFRRFAIDPRGILPSLEETEIIETMTPIFTAVPGFELPEDVITRAITEALLNEVACNPILRASSNIIIQIAERDHAEILSEVRTAGTMTPRALCSPSCSNGGTCIPPCICLCQPGFTGPSCEEDIDECTEGINPCQQRAAVCVNTIGSFECRCADGYRWNGTICEDINECSNPSACMNFYLSKCVNTEGSFLCLCRGKVCSSVLCSFPLHFFYGSVAINGLSYGSRAIYTCRAGFVLRGQNYRLCTMLGTWSGYSPRCIPFSSVRLNCNFRYNNFSLRVNCRSGVSISEFRCQIDDQDKFICNMPFVLDEDDFELARGRHTFTVIATIRTPSRNFFLQARPFRFFV